MKYKYYHSNGNLICEADSRIKFNEKLFPTFAEIEPVVEDHKKKSYYDKKEEGDN